MPLEAGDETPSAEAGVLGAGCQNGTSVPSHNKNQMFYQNVNASPSAQGPWKLLQEISFSL